jgi:hypothetical protein
MMKLLGPAMSPVIKAPVYRTEGCSCGSYTASHQPFTLFILKAERLK